MTSTLVGLVLVGTKSLYSKVLAAKSMFTTNVGIFEIT